MRARASFFLALCACHRHEDATPRVEPVASTTPSASASAPVAIGSAEIQEMVALLHSAAAAEPEVEAGTTTTAVQGTSYSRIGSNYVHMPSIRQGAMTVRGRLPPEVVRRVVRRSFGKLRYCYENGLKTDASLAGTVATQFVIDPKGNVTTTMRDATTTLKDASVVGCVTHVFADLTFPAPEGGIVVVTYAVAFAPSD